jgi:integrase
MVLRSERRRSISKVVLAKKLPTAGRETIFDAVVPQLELRRSASGVQSWSLRARVSGKQRRFTLGTVDALDVATARDKARELLQKVARGIDPAAETEAQRVAAATAAANTFGVVASQFIELWAKPRQRTWAETERILRSNCAPWLDRPMASITKRDVHALLDGFVAQGYPGKAIVTHSWLRTLWRWAAEREIVSAPLMVRRPAEKGVRERFLNDAELAAIWKSASELGLLEGAYVKLLLLSGVRKNELAGMRWEELDNPADPQVWTVPHERTKAKKTARPRPYIVPLPSLARRILKTMLRLDDKLVFPGRHAGRPMRPGTVLQKRIGVASGVKDFTFHVTRHSIASWLKAQGHSEWERGLVLNHSETTVTAGYSHGTALDLKRQLLEKWAGHIEKIAAPGEGANISLKGRAA